MKRILQRRPHQDHGAQYHEEQMQRLAHARTHCDLYVDTSGLSAEEVRAQVERFLEGVSNVSTTRCEHRPFNSDTAIRPNPDP